MIATKNRFFGTVGKYLTLAAILLLGWQLLAGSAAAAQGVRQSLAVCGNVLIPSLFPFMVLAAFVPATAAGRLAATPFGLVGRLLYGLPRETSRILAPALLMSWIGGYPAGARTLSALVEQKRLSPENAGRALCFCVNSGPAFMVTVVGAGIFGSARIGLLLFVSQLVAGALTARILLGRRALGTLPPRQVSQAADQPVSVALVSSVSSGAAGMISICAFVLICGGLAALLNSSGVLAVVAHGVQNAMGGRLSESAAFTLINGSIEICMGCAGAQQLEPMQALLVLPFLLSFSGLSCICQVTAMSGGQNIPMGKFLLSRPIHGLLTQLIAWLLLRESCAALPAGIITTPALAQDPKSFVGTLLLLAMCGILFLTLETEG
ncbi:MAG: hypothetical protein RSF82_10300 [Angelakisella sp.]